jgi:mannose-6-phosphate isomerase-like protein (cupin superfamily)
MSETATVTTGDGYAVSNLDDLGEGPGFRKIRSPLGVTAFGANALVLPPGVATGFHYHDRQEELYFVHQGRIRMTFDDGSEHELGPGGLARVDAATHRKIANIGDDDAVYFIVGGAGGYVERDGHRLPDEDSGSSS